MRRARANRRKTEPMRMPKLPKVPTISIRWRLLLVVPAVLAAAVPAADIGRAFVDRPVRELIVEGTFQRVTAVQIEAALDAARAQSFFSVDLPALRDSVAEIDWVDTVELSRVWPAALRVRVTEHHAAASWGDGGLLNTRGELFTETARYEYPELPKLSGPTGSEQRVAELYLRVRPRLADVNLTLDSIRLDDRGALTITLAGGQQVRFGARDVDDRLDRFFSVAAPVLADEIDQVEYVDLRYPNGFAVGWREAPPAGAVQLAEAHERG